jgi:apolipoprotein N-acyltransferase
MKGVSLLLPLLSGVALWLAFPDFAFFPLAWVGLIPYLFFLTSRPGWGRVLVGHLLFSGLYFGGVLYWIPRVMVVFGGFGWPAALGAYALLLLLLAVFLAPFTVLTRMVAARSPRQALVCAAGFWLLTELVRNYYLVNGFPWASLGYSQYPYLWVIQIADLGSVYLISFLIVLGNAAVLSLFRYRDWKLVGLFATLLLAANLYGAYRVYLWRPVPTGSVKVALVQPDVALAAGTDHYATKYFEEMPTAYRHAVAEGADWVIFPEAQNPYFFNEDYYYRSFLSRLVATTGVPLLFNSTNVESETRYFNSALLLAPSGQLEYRYDKTHLVPFGEYVPAKEWFSFMAPLTHEVSAFTPGRKPEIGRVKGLSFGTLICFESTFPEMAREYEKLGAQILVILTNDAWYGRTAAPEQHLEMGAFRAIENRRVVLRAANSGYSAVIDPLGRFRRRSGLFERDLIVASVNGYSGRTPYSYIGQWPNIILIGVSVPLAFRKGKGLKSRGGRKIPKSKRRSK